MANPFTGGVFRPITLDGFRTIDGLLKTLEKKHVKPAVRKGLRAGAKVVMSRAKELVPYDEGLLEDTLKVRVASARTGRKLKRGDIGFSVVHIGQEGFSSTSFRSKSGRKQYELDPFYSRWVEYGTKFHDPDPYIRPALYDSASKVNVAVRLAIKTEVARVRAK